MGIGEPAMRSLNRRRRGGIDRPRGRRECAAVDPPGEESIHHGLDMDLKSALLYEIEAYNRLVITEDRLEGVRAFNEKRKPAFKGR